MISTRIISWNFLLIKYLLRAWKLNQWTKLTLLLLTGRYLFRLIESTFDIVQSNNILTSFYNFTAVPWSLWMQHVWYNPRSTYNQVCRRFPYQLDLQQTIEVIKNGRLRSKHSCAYGWEIQATSTNQVQLGYVLVLEALPSSLVLHLLRAFSWYDELFVEVHSLCCCRERSMQSKSCYLGICCYLLYQGVLRVYGWSKLQESWSVLLAEHLHVVYRVLNLV